MWGEKCRVCGRKSSGYVHNKNSNKCEALLSTLLDINVTTEPEDTFPPIVCNSCYIILKKAKEEGRDIMTTALQTYSWEPHTDFCQLCLEVCGDSSGGRPKRKRKGRPRDDEPAFQQRKSMG